ncbi:glycine N-methyltransferase [Hetaerina americana]|uniref:glycine N-methyltransferase n=1 Tax=Hetaerina americana TaxID=62018 RepID=UPI003A7F57D8
MVDSVFRTRSLGAPAEGVKDQYADGKAAKVWTVYVGDKKSRTKHYRDFLVGLLREKGCKSILDVACGTGVDSMLLVEEGFQVTSVDASDKMLKYALKSRWERRKEASFDNWVIEEANWLTLTDDIKIPGNGFDAVICLGNSFAHMHDSTGDMREIKTALKNFERCVKPGGLLLIDHRNYDYIIRTGETPTKCIYYNSKHTKDIHTSVLYVNGKPHMVTMDYVMDISEIAKSKNPEDDLVSFRLSYYPHTLESFREMLEEAFEKKCKQRIYGDFKPLNEIKDPGFLIHVVEKLK